MIGEIQDLQKMSILYTSDIHAGKNHLFSLFTAAERERSDCIIVGGDIIPHFLPDPGRVGSIKTQEAYLRNVFVPAVAGFKRKRNTVIYLDFGNDDWVWGRKTLENYDGELFHLLHMKKHRLTEAVEIIGYMNVPPTPFYRKDWEKIDSLKDPYLKGHPIDRGGFISVSGKQEKVIFNLNSDDTIENDLARLSETIGRPFLFVSHCPPYGTPLDVLYTGQHIGSPSIRRFIEKWAEEGKLIGSLHGHIHESPMISGEVATKIGNSICINPGQNEGENADLRYAVLRLTDLQGLPRLDLVKASKIKSF